MAVDLSTQDIRQAETRTATRIFESFAGRRVAVAGMFVHKTIDLTTSPPNPLEPRTKRYTINYVLEGSGFVETETGPHPFQAGSVLQRQSKPFHPIRWSAGNVTECYFCFHEPTGHALHTLGVIDATRTVINVGLSSKLLSLLEDLFTAIETQMCSWDDTLNRLIKMLAVVSRTDDKRAETSGAWLDRACEILATQHHRRYTLAEIADMLDVSVEKFRKDFRRTFQVSPGEFRIRRRIERACSLLANQSIKEVAYALGYPDPKTFSRQFHKFTGMSPTQFQQGSV